MAQASPGPDAFKPFDSSAFEGPRAGPKLDIPDGLWMRCPSCEGMLYRKTVNENLQVCPECDHHFRVGARQRIVQLADVDSFEELFANITPADPLEFKWGSQTYADRLRKEQAKAGTTESILTGIAYVKGRRVALAVMNGEFLMGSMGCVLGEKFSLLVEYATEHSMPLVAVCMSGGARMHEGILSLMQMGKTSAALAKFDDAGGLYMAIFADPTTAGVLASFASLADVIIAEPGALIGFAGQRVIANTIKAELPEGFQRAEFLLEHGFIDMIVHRKELRSQIARLIDYCEP